MQFMLWYSLLLRTLYLLTAEHSIKSSLVSRLVCWADWWSEPTQERINRKKQANMH